MRAFKATFTGVAIFFMALSAHAAIVTFNFTINKDANNNPSYVFSNGGVDLSVSAWSTANGLATRDSQDIRQNGAGLGVDGNGSAQVNTPAPGFPDTGIAEWLSFSTNVGDIVGVGVNKLGPGEEVDFWGSDAADFNLGNFDFLGTLNGVGAISIQDMAVNLGSQPFLMVASSVPVRSGFRVATIDVALPEPGTLGFLFMGLLGMGFLTTIARPRRRETV